MNTNEDLQLKIGPPEDKDHPASFSRFVFPFAYCLEKLIKQPEKLCYQRLQNNDANFPQRKKYLTNETALVLFERAKWFEMDKVAWGKTSWATKGITVTLKTGDYQIKMLPPVLVLFEYDLHQTENNDLQSGFLCVDIYFPKQNSKPILDDLLQLNELFRYFDSPFDGHFKKHEDFFKNIPVNYPVDNGNYQKLGDNEGNASASYFARWLNLLNIPINDNSESFRLIPEAWMSNAEQWINCSEISKGSNCLVHADNRCYVWSAAILNEGGHSLDRAVHDSPSEHLHAHTYGHWIKLLNIDEPKDTPLDTHQLISAFEQQWAKNRTYKRWEHEGNWYGFNNHSGVMLLSALSPSHLCPVFREQYFDQTVLLLYLRTTLFRFSRKLSLIVHEQTKKTQTSDNKDSLEKIRQVREEFSHFAILYQFPSLSNQQQAIEMYSLARKRLDVDDLYREVQEEIASTHDFLEQAESNKLGKAANLIAQWGIPIALASVVASVFGMNNYGLTDNCKETNCTSLFEIGIEIVVVILAVVAGVIFIAIQKNKTDH